MTLSKYRVQVSVGRPHPIAKIVYASSREDAAVTAVARVGRDYRPPIFDNPTIRSITLIRKGTR